MNVEASLSCVDCEFVEGKIAEGFDDITKTTVISVISTATSNIILNILLIAVVLLFCTPLPSLNFMITCFE